MPSHWSYRVLRRTHDDPSVHADDRVTYQVHEVLYDHGGRAGSVVRSPASLLSDSLDGVRWQLQEMQHALERPILDYATLRPIDDNDSAAPTTPAP